MSGTRTLARRLGRLKAPTRTLLHDLFDDIAKYGSRIGRIRDHGPAPSDHRFASRQGEDLDAYLGRLAATPSKKGPRV